MAEGNALLTPQMTSWGKGKSGNPGGRPAKNRAAKDQHELFAEQCRKLWPDMLKELKHIALDREEKAAQRIAAIRMVLHWAFGKPVTSAAINVEVNHIATMPEHERASRLQAIISLAQERQAAEQRRNLEGTATIVDVEDAMPVATAPRRKARAARSPE